MAYGGGGAAVAAAHAAIVQAVKASGVIVRLEPDAFMTVLNKIEKPLVVMAPEGWLKKDFAYLTSYKGLCFYTKCRTMLMLPGSAELIAAKQIWVPA
jgi:hypothetical protein